MDDKSSQEKNVILKSEITIDIDSAVTSSKPSCDCKPALSKCCANTGKGCYAGVECLGYTALGLLALLFFIGRSPFWVNFSFLELFFHSMMILNCCFWKKIKVLWVCRRQWKCALRTVWWVSRWVHQGIFNKLMERRTLQFRKCSIFFLM